MAKVYRKPGIYVEEISKNPLSVAQVETAIPAFIGYTEKADDIVPDDLHKKPTRIRSMPEFEKLFGTDPSLTISEVVIDEGNNFTSAKIVSGYYMYDSLRLFYANGGGDCFIVSIGKYPASPAPEDFTNGIDSLLTIDGPTILLFPDAVTMRSEDLATVQNHALNHCGDKNRLDRVTIMDLKDTDLNGTEFRTGIGEDFLSYGMAYTPWLKTNLPNKVTYPDIKNSLKKNGASVTLRELTGNEHIQEQIDELEKVYSDIKTINIATEKLASPSINLRDRYNELYASFNSRKSAHNLQAVISYVLSILLKINKFLEPGNANELTAKRLKEKVVGNIPVFVAIAKDLTALDKEAKMRFRLYKLQSKAADFTSSVWNSGFVSGKRPSEILTKGNRRKNYLIAGNKLTVIFNSLYRAYTSVIIDAALDLTSSAGEALVNDFPLYKNILDGISKYISPIPPGGAIAGVYATVDRTQGVWRTPANVSLNSVIEPVHHYTQSQLDNLNVDIVTGKSINTIRRFQGKGTLVWGARTLAGNDNEWRYIPVRRLAILIEKSVKNSTQQFTFEPNDTNTWVNVRSMIENYLLLIWRQGALRGTKPEHAFFVSVGLGQTMSEVDILEGRMNIEIGFAPVRPAEFIIIRFSHKMGDEL